MPSYHILNSYGKVEVIANETHILTYNNQNSFSNILFIYNKTELILILPTKTIIFLV